MVLKGMAAMKKSTALLAGVLALGLCACGGDDNPAASAPYTLTITNNTEQVFISVFISLNSDFDSGEDWLAEGETLAPGQSRTFQIERRDVYDVQLLNEAFNSYSLIGREIKKDLTWEVTEEDCFIGCE